MSCEILFAIKKRNKDFSLAGGPGANVHNASGSLGNQ